METAQFVNPRFLAVQSVLSNGLTVLTGTVPSALVTAQVLIRAGSAHDVIPGEAHFLEHILAEGPAREGYHPKLRPLYAKGLGSNASTNVHRTAYEGTTFREHLGELLDSLIAIACAPDIQEQDVDDERGPILREVEESATHRRYLHWRNRHFFPDTPWTHRAPCGTDEPVRCIRAADLQAFHERHYHAANFVILVAGPATHAEVLAHIERLLLRIPVANQEANALVRLPKKIAVQATYEDSHIASELELHYQMPEDDYFETQILQLILALLNEPGQGLLWKALRQQAKSVYSATALRNTGLGANNVIVELPIAEDKFPLAEDATREAFRQIREGAFDKEILEIIRARDRMGFAAKRTPTTEELVETLEECWTEGHLPRLTYDHEATVRSITQEHIVAFANAHLNQEPFGRIKRVRRPL